jgi:hypothetical protein
MKRVWCIVVFAALTACGPSAKQIADAKREHAARVKASEDAATIKTAEEAASRELKDPQSAQFRDVTIRDRTVCGEMNAKNAYGAYVGFEPFHVTKPEPGHAPLPPQIAASVDPVSSKASRWQSLHCLDVLDNKAHLTLSKKAAAWSDYECEKLDTGAMTFWERDVKVCDRTPES